MKRITALCVALIILITSIVYTPRNVEANNYSLGFKQYFDRIEIKWKKVDGAKKYQLYRTKVKANYNGKVKKSKYKRIKTLKKNKYTDTSAKRNTFYKYYVIAIGKNKKKLRDSYNNEYDYRTSRLFIGPTRAYVNRTYKDRIKLELEAEVNDAFHSVICETKYEKKMKFIAFRRLAGKKKFKKINIKKKGKYWIDKSVKPGKRYEYKFKGYLVYKHKKYKGVVWSEVKKTAAVNYKPKLKVEAVSASKTFENVTSASVVIRVRNASKYNGKTVFYREKHDYDYTRYISINTKEDLNDWFSWNQYNITFDKYSFDGVGWQYIGKKGVSLPKDRPLFLMVNIYFRFDQKSGNIYYAADDNHYYSSYFDFGYDMQYEGYSTSQRWYLVNDYKTIK